jgi:hypothetical protein
MMSHGQNGLENLSAGSGRHVAAADLAPQVMDDAFGAQDSLETPNEEFMMNLEAVAERHRIPAQDHL